MPTSVAERCLRAEVALFTLVLSLGLWVVSFTASADTWAPPEREVYYAADKRTRLTVTPRDISNPLEYFEDKQKGSPLPGQQPGSARTFARGVLERLQEDGRWVVVWDRHLVNEVSPVSALVGDTGSYVVTFDNWHFLGLGENVVVIYGPNGGLVRSLALDDFLPDYYIKALPRSVSSIDWHGEDSISEATDTLILRVLVPSDGDDRHGPYVDRRIRLSTGEVIETNDPSWQRALAEASRVAQAKQAAEDAADAAFRAPLLGPATTKEADWHGYLREAFFRLDPDWSDGYPATHVLRAPEAIDYQPTEDFLRRELLEERKGPGDVVMIASPASPGNLVKVLTAIVGKMKPSALNGVRIYVAAPVVFRTQIAAALAPAAANFIHLDPARPIPQRKERLELRFGNAN